VKPARLISVEPEWSEYQQAVFDAVTSAARGDSFLVEAVAGAGKTTTLVEAARRARPGSGGVLMTAFATANVGDLAARVPGTVEVRSLHSLGFALLRAAMPGEQFNVQKNRTSAAVAEYLARGGSAWRPAVRPVAAAVKYAKNLGLTHEDEDGIMACARTHLGAVLARVNPERVGAGMAFLRAADTIKHCLKAHAELSSVVDFDDMIWLPHVLGLRPTHRYDWLVVDEAQDLNPPQMSLVLKSTRGAGHVIAAGDPAQAIYEFRGAGRDSMRDLATQLGGVRELPLSISYRCSQAVVAYVQRFVPRIQAAPGAPEGSVAVRTYEDMVAQVEPGDLVLARTNIEVLRAAMRLLALGKRVAIKGRAMRERLVGLLEQLDASSVRGLAASARKWQRAVEPALRAAPSAEGAADELAEMVECIVLLCDACASVAQVITTVSTLFSDAPGANTVILSTVHRAKGMEAPRVWCLREADEDYKLAYVASTRAERDLMLVDLPLDTSRGGA